MKNKRNTEEFWRASLSQILYVIEMYGEELTAAYPAVEEAAGVPIQINSMRDIV